MRALGPWLVVVALLLGLHGRMAGFNRPFEDGDRGARAALFAIVAENYLENGLLATGAVPILNPQRVEPEHFRYYMNHPPGAGILTWVGANLGGSNPQMLRFTFLPFSLGVVLLVYRLARGRHPIARAAAGVVAALTPLAVYYGAFVNFEVPTIFFVLLTLHLFLRYLRRGRQKDRTRALITMAVAVGFDWIALLLPVALMLVLPLRRSRGAPAAVPHGAPLRQATLLLCVGVTVAALVRILYAVQLHRYGVPSDPEATNVVPDVLDMTFFAHGFAAGEFLARTADRLVLLMGWPLLVAAALGICIALGAAVRRRLRSDDVAALTLLVLGLANVVLLAVYANDHEYFLLYLIPPAALATARVVGLVCSASATARAAPARLAAGALLVVLLGAHLFIESRRLLETRLTYEASALGYILRRVIPGDHTIVFLPGAQGFLQVVASTDMYVDYARSPAEIETKKDLARQYGMSDRPVVMVIAGANQPSPQFLEHLEANYRKLRIGSFDAYDLGSL
jgi:4-amino-4-deoxy-L-arabinose transferase-like glycosyltransferase